MQEVTIAALKALFPSEIRKVSILGVDEPLNWAMTDEGLKITPSAGLPSEIAVTFKIERQHPFEGTHQDFELPD